MTRLVPAAALALMLAACSSQDAPAPEPSETGSADTAATPLPTGEESAPATASSPEAAAVLTPTGLGNLVIARVPPASGAGAWKEDGVQLSDQCRTLHSKRVPSVYAMTNGKTVQRITVSTGAKVQTDRGIAPGSTEAQVRKAYPEAVESPHKYVGSPAKYLTWQPIKDAPGLRFETDTNRRVIAIHAGLMPWLAYVEGCA